MKKSDSVQGLAEALAKEDGAPERGRTSNLQIRSLTLYPVELRAQNIYVYDLITI